MSETATLRILNASADLAALSDEELYIPTVQPPSADDLDCERWDTDTCLHVFRRALCDRDADAAVQSLRAMDRLGCWHQAFEQLAVGNAAFEVRGSAVLWLWNRFGLHVADSLKGDPIVATVLRALLPPYSGPGCTLYRAELGPRLRARVYGMSWTADFDMASAFATQRGADCALLRVQASPQMIIVPPMAHTRSEIEREYLLDPALIEAVEVL